MINASLDQLVASRRPIRDQAPIPDCTVDIGLFVLSLQMQVIDVSSWLLSTLGNPALTFQPETPIVMHRIHVAGNAEAIAGG